ncbi:hypothetical protein OUZ56_009340 [Daphnia magna]|uniref:Uncharacterized protein n=1 Tax=Daphnia magna TaxID=35525 RepID=A0ABR0AFW0_9CRUS|nr:hypothetical protein OUZ56_009340 [Daphnia magna]
MGKRKSKENKLKENEKENTLILLRKETGQKKPGKRPFSQTCGPPCQPGPRIVCPLWPYANIIPIYFYSNRLLCSMRKRGRDHHADTQKNCSPYDDARVGDDPSKTHQFNDLMD